MLERPNGSSPDDSGSHPDIVQIEAVRTGEGSAADRAHVQTCAHCQGILRDLEGFSTELSTLSRPPFEIPEERDRAILHAAGQRARAARRQRIWRRVSSGPALAIAAGALLAVAVFSILGKIDQGVPVQLAEKPAVVAPPHAAIPGDINDDGVVDILDAYVLAQAIETHRLPDARWDLNADTRVDPADVDAIARRVVALGGA